jgi:hypothetical protein
MAPLIVTALVGIGVKIATDLLMAGAKDVMRPSASVTSFASTLDKARSATAGAAAGLAGTKLSALDAGFGDRSRVLAAELAGSPPAAGRAYGVASYRQFQDIPQVI